MHPVLLDIPFLGPLYSYGTMLALSFLAGWFLTHYFVKRDNVTNEETASSTIKLAIVGAIIGARVLYFIVTPDSFRSMMDFFAFKRGGMVAYGGFIGGTMLGVAYLLWRRAPVLRFCDASAPALALGTAITRIGCLMYGCDFGSISHRFWAISFPAGSPAFNQQLKQGLLAPDTPMSLPVHPTQIYESTYGFLIFILVVFALNIPKSSRKPGLVFLTFSGLYALMRFLNEFLRADISRGFIGPVSTSQFIALFVLTASIVGFAYIKRSQVPAE